MASAASLQIFQFDMQTDWIGQSINCRGLITKNTYWVAATAPWFCLHLPSCSPGLESQAHHLHFYQFVLKLYQEKNENKQKEAGIGPFFKKTPTCAAAIASWCHPHLPSCGPRFESQAHHLCFLNLY